MMGIVDVKQQLAGWSIATTIAWAIGGTEVALVNLFVGSGGTLLDPLLPALVLGIIFLFVENQLLPSGKSVTGSARWPSGFNL